MVKNVGLAWPLGGLTYQNSFLWRVTAQFIFINRGYTVCIQEQWSLLFPDVELVQELVFVLGPEPSLWESGTLPVVSAALRCRFLPSHSQCAGWRSSDWSHSSASSHLSSSQSSVGGIQHV